MGSRLGSQQLRLLRKLQVACVEIALFTLGPMCTYEGHVHVHVHAYVHIGHVHVHVCMCMLDSTPTTGRRARAG
jgi:hypothetical protein